MEDQKQHLSLFKYSFILIFLLVLFSVIYLVKQKNSLEQRKNAASTKTALDSVKKATMTLSLLYNNEQRFQKDKEIDVYVVVDSVGKEVVGFDTLIQYDKTAFDFVDAVSLIPDYKIKNLMRDTHIAITGILVPQSDIKTVLNDVTLLKVSFMPKKTGFYDLSIVPKAGQETTDIVDSKSNVEYPRVNTITVEIY